MYCRVLRVSRHLAFPRTVLAELLDLKCSHSEAYGLFRPSDGTHDGCARIEPNGTQRSCQATRAITLFSPVSGSCMLV